MLQRKRRRKRKKKRKKKKRLFVHCVASKRTGARISLHLQLHLQSLYHTINIIFSCSLSQTIIKLGFYNDQLHILVLYFARILFFLFIRFNGTFYFRFQISSNNVCKRVICINIGCIQLYKIYWRIRTI